MRFLAHLHSSGAKVNRLEITVPCTKCGFASALNLAPRRYKEDFEESFLPRLKKEYEKVHKKNSPLCVGGTFKIYHDAVKSLGFDLEEVESRAKSQHEIIDELRRLKMIDEPRY